jgi:hypothetical protein
MPGPIARVLRPVAAASTPAFAAVLLACSSPTITADPVWLETVAPARPATAPHEETPPESLPLPTEPLAPTAPPIKKLAPKPHVPKPPTPYIAPDPTPYMLGGDIESVRVGPENFPLRRA